VNTCFQVPRLNVSKEAFAALNEQTNDGMRLIRKRWQKWAPLLKQFPAAVHHWPNRCAILAEELLVARIAQFSGPAQSRLKVRNASRALRWQIDAIAIQEVAAHILHVVHQLQRGADAVTQCESLLRGKAKDRQHQATHGVRTSTAVRIKFVPSGVTNLDLIFFKRADEIRKWLDGKFVRHNGWSQSNKHRMTRRAVKARLQFTAPPRQQLQSLFARRSSFVT
jgi:hypothetical protein